MLTVHMGVRPGEIDTLKAQSFRLMGDAIQFQRESHILWDKDSHERVEHLIVNTVAPMATLQFIVNQFSIFLVPNTQKEIDGVLLLVTDAGPLLINDYIELRYPD